MTPRRVRLRNQLGKVELEGKDRCSLGQIVPATMAMIMPGKNNAANESTNSHTLSQDPTTQRYANTVSTKAAIWKTAPQMQPSLFRRPRCRTWSLRLMP